MLGRIFVAAISFLVAATFAYLAVIVGIAIIWDLMGVVDRDGGGAMAIAFFFAPIAALIGGIFGARAALSPRKDKD